jgi:predicted nuclease of predicted toxin-antitoxin system
VRILADENVEALIIARLRAEGHVVDCIADQAPGIADHPVLAFAVSENVLLLTADRDFGDYVFRDRLGAPAEGVVLYRLGHALSTPEKARIIVDAFAQQSARFAGQFSVIEESGVRFRPLP